MKQVKAEALADVHYHLRSGHEIMSALMQHAYDGGADVLGIMPNLKPPLTLGLAVNDYRALAVDIARSLRIEPFSFMPFVMITEDTKPAEIDLCVAHGIWNAKVYPRYRTTQSEEGVVHYGRILDIVKHCGKVGMKVHFHPEHPSKLFINRSAEFAFLPLARMFLEESDTIIVWEHGTDANCIPHWVDMASTGRFFVTLTAHHLATNEDKTFGDIRSTCKPPIKTEYDRIGLVELVKQGYGWVMAGTDSAWHPRHGKHVDEGCCACGAFTAPFALPLYAHALSSMLETDSGIGKFIDFTSRNARRLHRLPPASRLVTLANEKWKIPLSYPVGSEEGLPFWAGNTIDWKLVG
jgi:dihydroorotase